MDNMYLKINSGCRELWWRDHLVMSEASDVSERALANHVLESLPDKSHVLVGGLGFGYTVDELLQNDANIMVDVIEQSDAVINWVSSGILPNTYLIDSPRVNVKCSDFFEMMRGEVSVFYDGIMVDIDSYPWWIDEQHADFYTVTGLMSLCRHLKAGGIFGLWTVSDRFCPLDESLFRNVFDNIVIHKYPTETGRHAIIIGENRPC